MRYRAVMDRVRAKHSRSEHSEAYELPVQAYHLFLA
jgi:hypothetical protein